MQGPAIKPLADAYYQRCCQGPGLPVVVVVVVVMAHADDAQLAPCSQDSHSRYDLIYASLQLWGC